MPIVQTNIISNRPETKGQEMSIRAYRWTTSNKTLGVVFGHFAPFTGKYGHARMIEEARNKGIDHFMVVMPETQGHDKERNLFTNAQRKKIVQEANKELNLDIDRVYITSGSSIKQILRHLAEEFGNERIVLICGPDRYPTYRKQFIDYKENEDSTDETNSPDFNKFEIMGLSDRGENATSATQVRKCLLEDNEAQFKKLTGYSHKMYEMMREFVKENEDLSITTTKRSGIKHLYNPSVSSSVKVSSKEFIDIINWLKTQNGKLDDSINVDYTEKSDGAAFRFGLNRSGRFFIEQSNSGPLYSAKDITDRAMNRDGTINRSGKGWANVFNELQNSEKIQSILQKYNNGDGIKIVGEIFINEVGHAGKSDELIAFVGTEYLKAKIGSFFSIIIINCINGDGMTIKKNDELKNDLIQASTSEVMFDDVHYDKKFGKIDFNPEIAEFDKIVTDVEKEAKKSILDILSSRKKSDSEIKKQIDTKINDLMKKFDDKFRELFKNVGGKWGPDREGIVIKLANDTMLKVTSDVFKDFKKAQHERDMKVKTNESFLEWNNRMKQYNFNEAHISSSVDKCMKIAEEMCDKVNEAGGELYIIGGATRDYVMGKTPNDLDMMTTLEPQVYADLFGTSDIRHRKDRILVVPVVDGEEFETSCVLNKRSVAEHLNHCDLTCNAMAMDIRTKKIIDPTGGQADIASKILRGTKYYIDQWNVGEGRGGLVRFFVFLARLGFKPDPVSVAGIKKYSELRDGSIKLQPFIFNKAFDKIAVAKYADRAIKLFQECGFHESLMKYQRHYAKFCIEHNLTMPSDDVETIKASIDAHEAEKAEKEAKAAARKATKAKKVNVEEHFKTRLDKIKINENKKINNFQQYFISQTNPIVNEAFTGDNILLYTTSKDDSFEKYFNSHSLRFANNAGNMYGLGIYTTLEAPKDSKVGYSDKKRENLYGNNVYELVARGDNFFYFLYDWFVKSPLYTKLKSDENTFIKDQFKYFGIEMPSDEDLEQMTPSSNVSCGQCAFNFYKYMNQLYYQRKDGTLDCPITGFIYFGKNDGLVGVVWAPYRCKLTRKSINGAKWENITDESDDYVEENDYIDRIFDGNMTDEKVKVYKLLTSYKGEHTPIGQFTDIVIHDNGYIDATYKSNIPQADGYRHCYMIMNNKFTDKIHELGYKFGVLNAWVKLGNSTQVEGNPLYLPSNAPKEMLPKVVTEGIYLTGMDDVNAKEIRACSKINSQNDTLFIRKSYVSTANLHYGNVTLRDCWIKDDIYDEVVSKYTCVDNEGELCVMKESEYKAKEKAKADAKAAKEAAKKAKEEEKARKVAEKEAKKTSKVKKV